MLNRMVIVHFSRRLYEFKCENYPVYLSIRGPPVRRPDNLWARIISSWKPSLGSLVTQLWNLLWSETFERRPIIISDLVPRLCRLLEETQALRKLGRVADAIRYRLENTLDFRGDLIRAILELNWLSRLLASLIGEMSYQISSLPTRSQLECAAALYPQFFRALSQSNILHHSVEIMMTALQIRADAVAPEGSLETLGPDLPNFLTPIDGREGEIAWPKVSISLIEVGQPKMSNLVKSSRTKVEPAAEGDVEPEVNAIEPRLAGSQDRNARSDSSPQ